jgi:hypothetical protein
MKLAGARSVIEPSCDGTDLLLQRAGVDRNFHVDYPDQLYALIEH